MNRCDPVRQARPHFVQLRGEVGRSRTTHHVEKGRSRTAPPSSPPRPRSAGRDPCHPEGSGGRGHRRRLGLRGYTGPLHDAPAPFGRLTGFLFSSGVKSLPGMASMSLSDTRPSFSRLTEGKATQSWRSAIPVVVIVSAFVALLAYLASAMS